MEGAIVGDGFDLGRSFKFDFCFELALSTISIQNLVSATYLL